MVKPPQPFSQFSGPAFFASPDPGMLPIPPSCWLTTMAAAVLPALRLTPPASNFPALLPTPPRSQMLPLLPTPCLIILPASFRAPPASDPKPGRADAVERWDAHKKPGYSVASSSSSSSEIPCRADACERWDANKNKKAGGSAASSSTPAAGTQAAPTHANAEAVQRWDSNKRPLSRASSTAERWDINKKPRPKKDAVGSGKSNSTSRTMKTTTSAQMISKSQTETMVKAPLALLPFSGPAYFSAPDPSMLPCPPSCWLASYRRLGSLASTSSRASGGSPGRADSCERWDAHKTPGSPASSTGSNGSACRSDSVERWDSSKRPLSRASSAERWDINKKPRPEEDYALCSGKSNSTSRTMKTTTSAQMISKPHTETVVKPPPALLPFAGPAAYFSAPDPSMLPVPTFLLARCR
uniref:Uncharacterized protein n=1 Tax=Oryza barthii TaxID=65489 RepID=A0A0D3H0S9_9ORYZ